MSVQIALSKSQKQYLKQYRFNASALVTLLIISTLPVYAQSTYAPLNEDYYHWIDRYEVKAGRVVSELFTTIKPYKRDFIVAYLDSLKAREGVFTSATDQFNYNYLQNDSWEWSRAETSVSNKPFLKHFYRRKSDFYHVDEPAFDLHVNPVLYLSAGNDTGQDDPLFVNLRGVEVRGMIDRKIGFYTFLAENQSRLPSYIERQLPTNPVIPHELFWKRFKETGVDFFQARAYIDFNVSPHVYLQFGQDKTFIGNGYRSLILSNHAPPSLFLRVNAKVWKINYLFQLNRVAADAFADVSGSNAGPYPTKYVAIHHASINIGKKLNVGVFESVIFDADSASSFDLSYLNPIIFYRAIEQQFGSTDNVILGADFKWNVAKKISLYGQFVLDEFVLDEIRARNGWWANKFAIQGGLKYVDALGVNNLDIQLEANVVRPFTYSHNSDYGSYTHYRQPLAHPLGANFYEGIGIVRYQPLPRLNLVFKGIYAKKGLDSNATDNQGGNLLKDNATHAQTYGNSIAQGVANNILYLDFTASYMLKHNVFIDVKQIVRNSESDLAPFNINTSISSLALRWNIAQRHYNF